MQKEEKEQMYTTMRTAILTAYPKIFTDIEYAPEFFLQTTRLANDYGFSFQPELFVANMTVEIEARFKAVSKTLEKQLKNDRENTLVIELATGLSPRKLKFNDMAYYESDFSAIINLKKQLYSQMGHTDFNKNLFGVDLSNQKELYSFLIKIPNLKKYKKIIVISEGLFWYLNKEIISNMVRTFTSAFEGVNWLWISSDCPPKIKNETEYRNVISNSANVKSVKTFADSEDFHKFFNNLGYSVTQKSLTDLISPKKIYSGKFFSITEEDVKNRMESYTDIAIIKKAHPIKTI